MTTVRVPLRERALGERRGAIEDPFPEQDACRKLTYPMGMED
jgi:hypothetical protein